MRAPANFGFYDKCQTEEDYEYFWQYLSSDHFR